MARRTRVRASEAVRLVDLMWDVVRAAELLTRNPQGSFRGPAFDRRMKRLENAVAKVHEYWNPDERQ